MSQPMRYKPAFRRIATGVAASLTLCVAAPSALADPAPPVPIDPYAGPYAPPTYGAPPPPPAQPVDPYAGPYAGPYPPYATPATPPLVQQPAATPYPPPPPPYPPQYSPYPATPPPSNPYAPSAGGCPADCPNLNYHPAPPVTYEMRPRTGLISAGLSIWGSLWVLSTVSGVLSDHAELAIPVAGPILTAIDLNQNHNRSAELSLVTGLLITDALFQTTGLIMAIAGGVSRVKVAKRAPSRPSVYPAFSPYGAGVSGRF